MRILIATDHYPPFIGGAHRQAQLLATGMAGRGHDMAVVTPWHGGLPTYEDDGTVRVYRVRQIRTAIPAVIRDRQQRHQPPFPDPRTIWGLRRILTTERPDLIHAYGWFAFSVAAAMGRRRIPLLISARDYGYFCATRTLLRKDEPCSGPAPLKCVACASAYYGPPKGWVAVASVALSRPLLVRKASGFHSVSTYVHDVNSRYLFGSDSCGRKKRLVEATIPSFQTVAPTEELDVVDADAAAILEGLPKVPFILYVGAFRKVKGLQTIFDAYRLLSAPPPLVLIGTFERDSPPDFPSEAVVLTDVPHAAVMASWDRALFGVMPSLWPEPFGATVAEAMNRGKPVIGSRLGGHADMIDESNGVLVPQGDPEALAQAMKELIEDPERRETLGRAAAKRAHSFAASEVLPQFEQVYREMVGARSGLPGP